jgi:DNA-3-methyladenine glycosylase II
LESGSWRRDRFLLKAATPYSLALTAARFARFPETVDRFDGSVYRRLIPMGRGSTIVSVAQLGSPTAGTLEVQIAARGAEPAAAREAARSLIGRTLAIDQDVRPFYRAFRDDALLKDPIRRFRGLRIAGTASLWEALVTAILSQQINLRFAYDIRRELAIAFGRRSTWEGETFIGFPRPEAIARERKSSLRAFRLSRAKAVAIQGVARAFADGSLDEEEVARLSDEEAIEKLTAIVGVGRWTAEIALLRGLGRVDIFPAADLGVVKYLAQGLLGHAGRAREDDMRRYSERWRPYRGLALVYAYAELARRKKG